MKGGEKWWSFEVSQVSHRLKKKSLENRICIL